MNTKNQIDELALLVVEHNFRTFQELNLNQLNDLDHYPSRHYLVAGKRIDARFQNQKLDTYFNWQMSLLELPQEEVMNYELYGRWIVCIDDRMDEFSEILSEPRYQTTIKASFGKASVRILNGKAVHGVMFFWSEEARTGGMIISGNALPAFMGVSHNLTPLIALMSESMNCVLIHAASVGVNGKGCLISGLSGSGKSTLAAACLSYGMDFISDDSLLFDVEECKAYPINSTIHLFPDSYSMLSDLSFDAADMYPGRANKKHINLRPFSEYFKSELDIQCIIEPQISADGQVDITKTSVNPILMKLLYSSAYQLGEERDSVFSRNVMRAIHPLPAYRMMVGRDMKENAGAVEAFLKGM